VQRKSIPPSLNCFWVKQKAINSCFSNPPETFEIQMQNLCKLSLESSLTAVLLEMLVITIRNFIFLDFLQHWNKPRHRNPFIHMYSVKTNPWGRCVQSLNKFSSGVEADRNSASVPKVGKWPVSV